MSDPNYTQTPYMGLNLPTPSLDPGPDWAAALNAALAFVDQHTHNPGSGLQVTPSGLNINASLPFNNQAATLLQAANFTQQTSLATLNALWVGKDGNLYFNDGVGDPSIQITSGGNVLANASGISDPPASAAFVSSILTVLAAANTPADIQCASILMGNNVALTNYLTLEPPASMSSSFNLVLPTPPASVTSFLQCDSSGNITAAVPTTGGGIISTLAANATSGSRNLVVSNTNTTNQLAIVRGVVAYNGSIEVGEGFTVSVLGTGEYQINFTTPFADTPSVVATAGTTTDFPSAYIQQQSTGYVQIHTAYGTGGTLVAASFNFIAVGQV